MANVVNLSIIYVADPTIGRPVSNGSIYVGIVDLDPKVVGNQKQISVLQENGTTVAVSQPISTSAGGAPLYNGSPITILVDGSYSLRIDDSTGAQKYYVPKNAELESLNSFDSIDDLQAITETPEDGDTFPVLGYYTPGDGGGQPLYWDATSTETDNGITIFKATAITTGRFKSIDISLLNPLHAGCVADNTADDHAQLQAFVDLADVKNIDMPNGGVWKLTDRIDVPANKKVFLNGSTLNFDLATQTWGFDVQGDNVEISGGTINCFGQVFAGSGQIGSPVIAGVQSTGAGFDNLVFRDLIVSSTRDDGGGAGVGIIGECTNVLIENISTPDDGVFNNLVNCEWGGTDIVGTGHPNHIVINNITAGDISNARGIVWISSCFNVKITNIFADAVKTPLYIVAGDRANTYAPARYKDLIGKGITADNISCDAASEYALFIAGKGAAAAILDTDIKVSNINVKSTVGNILPGITLQYCNDVTVDNFEIDGFAVGFTTGTDVLRPVLTNGVFRNSTTFGAGLGSSTEKCVSPLIRNVSFIGNNTSASSSTGAAAVVLNVTDDPIIEGCTFGEYGIQETQKYSIYAADNDTQRPKIFNNHTHSLANGGFAYTFGAGTSFDILPMGLNNTAHPGLNLSGGVGAMRVTGKGNKIVNYSIAPLVGTWTRGDRTEIETPSAGSFIGFVCTASGTFSVATDSTGDTDGSTAVITGMGDTSDFNVGDFVNVSAGFASSVVIIMEITSATSITVSENSDAAVADITVDTTDPIFKTYGAITI